MAKTAKSLDKGEKQVDRLLLLLRMIPRRGRISTTEIQGRLNSEHHIVIGLRTIQRDLVDLSRKYPLVSEVRDGERSAGWSWMEDAPVLDIPIMDPLAALTFRLG